MKPVAAPARPSIEADLRAARLAAGLTHDCVAAHIGISRPKYTRIESRSCTDTLNERHRRALPIEMRRYLAALEAVRDAACDTLGENHGRRVADVTSELLDVVRVGAEMVADGAVTPAELREYERELAEAEERIRRARAGVLALLGAEVARVKVCAG